MTPSEIRVAVLAQIRRKPDTYSCLCVRLKGRVDDRAIDRALQNLRKAGIIEWTRSGRDVVWHEVKS